MKSYFINILLKGLLYNRLNVYDTIWRFKRKSLSLRIISSIKSLSHNDLGTFSLSPIFLWPIFWPTFYSEDSEKAMKQLFLVNYFRNI